MALHVMDEANHCLGCKKPRCQQGCPIHTNIPEVIRLLKENRLDDAGRMLFENNPLTTVCSLVCNHENQCEGHCVQGIKGAPVHFSVIENYISSTYASQMTKGPATPNGKKAAIIGSGPAGLTIAVILARYGYDVTIFESHDKIGGVLRYGIPEFRLPKSVLDDFEYRHLRLKDIKVRPNTDVGKALLLEDLFRDGYKAVFIGTGVWRPNTLHIKGESLGNVHYAINYLQNPDVYHLGRRLIVIGAGNAAMDVCRTALRHGTRHVECFSLSKKITASEYEASYAKLEGVNFHFNKKPVEITDKGVVFRDLNEAEDGTLTEAAVLADFYLGVLCAGRRIQGFGGGPDAGIRTLGGIGREAAENLPYCRILRKITDGAVGLEHIGELLVLRRAPPVGKRGKRGKSLSDLLPFKMLVNISLEGSDPLLPI